MPFYIRFNLTNRATGGVTEKGTSSSRSSVVESDRSSTSFPSYGNLNLLSVEVRLIMAMDDAMRRKRRLEAGEHVTRDSVEWWRCPTRKSGKLVVHPPEKCRDKLLPYPYPAGDRVPPHVTSTSWSVISVTSPETVPSVKRKRKRKRFICKFMMFYLLLFVLIIANVAALTWSALVALFWREEEIPLPKIPHLPRLPSRQQ